MLEVEVEVVGRFVTIQKELDSKSKLSDFLDIEKKFLQVGIIVSILVKSVSLRKFIKV
jgi:hypothetical protein